MNGMGIGQLAILADVAIVPLLTFLGIVTAAPEDSSALSSKASAWEHSLGLAIG